MNPTFWRDKRVLVTGHTGFKGAWLCMLLGRFGAQVAGYALSPPTKPSLYELARVDQIVDSTIGDVRHLETLCEQVSKFRPAIVFHMAAQSVVLRSYEEPVETYSTNALGTVHMLEAIRRAHEACTVVNVTTDKCYENTGQKDGYPESALLGGHDPYSNSKACSEMIGDCYRQSFFPVARFAEHGVALASARAGNVIGGGDWTPRQLIPDAIAAFAESRAVVLRHPGAVRPWQHVLDCLGGYLTLAEALANDARLSGAWNFGPPDADCLPVSSVVESLGRHCRFEGEAWIKDDANHAPEEQLLRLDATKAATLLNWKPRLRIDDALHWVADWYREFHAGGNARELSDRQIGSYLQR